MSLVTVEQPQPQHTQQPERARWVLAGHEAEVTGVGASGGIVASCDAGGTVLLWRPRAGQAPENVCRLRTGGAAVLATAFVRPTLLAAAQGDGAVTLWDVETGVMVSTHARAAAGRSAWPVVNAVASAHDGERVLYGGDDGYLMQLDARAARCAVARHMRVPVTAVACAERGSGVFVGDAAGGLHWLDAGRARGAAVVAALPEVEGPVGSLSHDRARGSLVVVCRDGAALVDARPYAPSPEERRAGLLDLPLRAAPLPLRRGDAAHGWVVCPAGDDVLCVPAGDFPAGTSFRLRAAAGSQLHSACMVDDSTVAACGTSQLMLFQGL